MDLPTCPACQQSVLDDDAVECPFCGAPMKGGAAAARPAPTPPAVGPKTSPARKAASKPGPADALQPGTGRAPAAKPRPGSSGEMAAVTGDDDDPFAVDQSASTGAIPVSRQQGPGKSVAVVCPMCETKGFVAPKAAGKLVKCCNPECLVPIFTAPAIEKKAAPPPPPPPPRRKLPWLYILGGVSAVAVAVACVIIMNQTGPTELPALPSALGTGDLVPRDRTTADSGKNDRDQSSQAGGPEKDGAAESAANSHDDVIKNALQRLVDVSFNIPNNRKSLWRRLAATAYVRAGELQQAREQLDLLDRPGSPSPSEGVLPLVALAWQKAGSPDEFKQVVERTARLAEKLPVRGRYATEAAVATAPLLVISGKTAEARKLVAGHRSEKGVEELAAALEVVVDDGTFNLDTVLPGRTVGDWQAPLDSAVILILASHGRWEDALAWATQSSDLTAKTEGTILWAELFATRNVPPQDAAGFERAKSAAEGLSPAGRVRLFARLANVKLSVGDRPKAEELMTQAHEALKAIAPAAAIKVQGLKPLLDLKLPDPAPLRQAALAAAEMSRVQARLEDWKGAWANILASVGFLQGIAPSKGAMQERLQQLEKDPKKIRADLKSALGLKSEDQIRQKFSQYKEKCNDVASATEIRYYWQGVVFESAADSGLLDQVWDELQVLDRKPTAEREPFLETAVPMHVAARFAAAGNQKKKEEIYKTIENRITPADPEIIRWYAEHRFNEGDFSGCIQQLNGGMTAAGVLHEWTLRLACRLVNDGKTTAAIAFCSAIKDVALREEGLALIAALAARQGRAVEFWNATSGLGPMETSAACSGLVSGLKAEVNP